MGSFNIIHKTLRLFLHARPNMVSLASLTQLSVLFLVLVLLSPPRVQGFGVCRNSFRCLNGGIERYGQSIFGPCRCRCPDGYTGPRCQYREAQRKRSSSLNVLSDYLQRRLAREQMEREEAERVYTDNDYVDVQPMERRRRSRTRLHPRFFRR